jgi:hypothetical protein
MTTKKNTSPKFTKQENLATEIGDLVGQLGSIGKEIDEKCQAIRTLRKNKPIGTQASDCAVMKRFLESQVARGLSENTIKNNCTTFRKAVNEGKKYDVNANRVKKGAKTTKSDDTQAVVKLTIVKDSTPEQVAEGLRVVFEAKREGYAELVSFLIDAIDEYEGK